MTRKWAFAFTLLFVLAFILPLTGAKGTPLIAEIQTTPAAVTGAGAFHDGNAFYEHGVNRLQCYFGTQGRSVVITTYGTGRAFRLQSDASASWGISGLPAGVNSEVNLYGNNYYGSFFAMGVGTTAQLATTIQFRHAGQRYEVEYQALATKRLSENTWLITSDPQDIGGFPGFAASDQAVLRIIQRKSVQPFGAVNLPVRIQVVLK